jgi:hypothetical protein
LEKNKPEDRMVVNNNSHKMSFIHKRQGPPVNNENKEEKNINLGKHQVKYRFLSVRRHLLLIIKGYFGIKQSLDHKDEILQTHFDKVSIKVTSEGLIIIHKRVFQELH